MRAQSYAALVKAATVVEDVVDRLVMLVVRIRGRRRPLVLPFIGHGSPRRIRVRARVVLGRSDAKGRAIPAADCVDAAPVRTAVEPRSRRAIFRASASRFLTVEIPGATVAVRASEVVRTVRADNDGYLDAVVEEPGLPPGWHDVELTLDDGTTATTPALVVDPRADVALVSDVDDTILETGITRGLALLRATLLTETADRAPLPGAAALYRALVTSGDGVWRPVFYVSTSPWNLHEMLLEFIALRHFPLGPLLLTDWGPGHGNLFRIGAREHKLGLIRGILDEHPGLGLVLVGDTGQLDPEIYATIAEERPDRIRAVYVRRTVPRNPRRNAEVDAVAARVTALGVPMLAVDDSAQIAEHAASIGLLDAAAVGVVRAETASH